MEPLPIEKWLDMTTRDERAIRNWFRLVYHTQKQSQTEKKEFILCAEHQMTFKILHAWWTADYQDPNFTLAGLRHFFGFKFSDTGYHVSMIKCFGDNLALFQELDKVLKMKHQPNLQCDITDLAAEEGAFNRRSEKSYNKQLMSLFHLEFFDLESLEPGTESPFALDLRRYQRGEAAIWSYCQQYAWAVYTSYRDSFDHSPAIEGLDFTPGVPDQTTDMSLAIQGPLANPCEWLKADVDEFRNLPYYLWDLKARRTVETSGLHHTVEYVSISHTWGRWWKDSPIAIPGVPWDVPQNSRFEVAALPEILLNLVSHIPRDIQYVWLDLVCIPQDHSAIGTREIARQAKIFRSARHAIAWLCDIESYSGLTRILNFLSIRLLKMTDPEDQARLMLVKLHTKADIIGKGCGLLNESEYSLNPWFTSLWCLQEICLRPDMWLAAKDGSLLIRNKDIPVPLSGIISLLETTMLFGAPEEVNEPDEYIGIALLVQWYVTSGFKSLLALDTASILTLAETRHCTARRGEAIMSALGVTDWFTSAIANDTDVYESLEKDLVLGKYPLAFVQELANKRPRDFFGTAHRLHVNIDLGVVSADPYERGSLLPFGEKQEGDMDTNMMTRIFGDRMQSSTTHHTVSKWIIHQSGSVHMPVAGILASSQRSTTNILPVTMLEEYSCSVSASLSAETKASLQIPQSREKLWVDLHIWVAKRALETHAVVLDHYSLSDGPRQQGVSFHGRGFILERLSTGEMSMVCHFVFHDMMHTLDIEQSDEVNWVVL